MTRRLCSWGVHKLCLPCINWNLGLTISKPCHQLQVLFAAGAHRGPLHTSTATPSDGIPQLSSCYNLEVTTSRACPSWRAAQAAGSCRLLHSSSAQAPLRCRCCIVQDTASKACQQL